MYFFTVITSIIIYVIAKKYTIFRKPEYIPDDMMYSRHPMSDVDSESEYGDSESDYGDSESDSSSLFEYEENQSNLSDVDSESDQEDVPCPVKYSREDVDFLLPDSEEKEIPCHMKDFYEETSIPEKWLNKSNEEKQVLLDEELNIYMRQDPTNIFYEHLKNIKC